MPSNAATSAMIALSLALASPAAAQTLNPNQPTWWNKFQLLTAGGPDGSTGGTALKVGPNVDASDECGPQSETFIAINSAQPATLAAGSNEIFRLPMRGYF